MRRIHVVRHAHAGDPSAWAGADSSRPLSAKGSRQASAIVDVLRDQPVTSIRSSPARRCRETVAPLAAARGLAVEEADFLREGTPAAVLISRFGDLVDGTVLCTHGDVGTDLVRQLILAGVAEGRNVDCEKASIWHIDVDEGVPVRATYRRPPGG